MRRTHPLVYGSLTAMVIGLYVLVVGYLGALLRAQNNLGVSLLATGLVTVVFQPLSGFWMLRLAGIAPTTRWVVASFALYLLAGACWLPVVWMQYRMRDIARTASAAGEALPPLYWVYLRRWVALGIPAFLALVIVFWMMVVKPV